MEAYENLNLIPEYYSIDPRKLVDIESDIYFAYNHDFDLDDEECDYWDEG